MINIARNIAYGCFLIMGLSACSSNGWHSSELPIRSAKTSVGISYVDNLNRPLYIFLRDEYGKSSCYKSCAEAWPPLLAGEYAIASGNFTLIKRNDGKMQWAIDDLPLYRFVDDDGSGEANGHRLAYRVAATMKHGS